MFSLAYFVDNHYKVTNGIITKYYYAGTQRIAIPQGDDVRKNGALNYIFGDHLGSTSIVTDANGTLISETKYKAWGEIRYSSGTNPSEYTYTGQYSYTADFGLMFYNARWYDPSLGRFAQADSVIPAGVQGLDRYAYTLNNPIIYNDPSGHYPVCQPGTRCLTPIADKRDLTQWLVVAAVDIAESNGMQSVKTANSEGRFTDANSEFISLVGDDEIYDVKKVIEIKFQRDPIKIGSNWFEYSTAGNILFGFYGTEAGYGELMLYLGAGKAQIDDWLEGDGELGSIFGDTPDDHYAIVFGIYLYDNFYKDDKTLTYSELLIALDNYPYLEQMAIVDKPQDFQPRYYDYPANRFYNYRTANVRVE